ncbi:GNAT family N-acetyltransferase [Thalassotalea sp. SU-HH00458]|uniref:GNAT family N-acetyltransferase n=1 Tax=Thalassotalea sp. SU-HH00458 TaxID=3127657 RepID=UPI00310AB349
MNSKYKQSLKNSIQINTQQIFQDDFLSLKKTWMKIEKRAKPSFFLSWKWIGSWLNIISKNKTVILVTAQQNNTIVGLGIFVEKLTTRHCILKSKQWYLHRTGDEKEDQIWIENNDFLIQKKDKTLIKNVMWEHLVSKQNQVDEFIVNVSKKSEFKELPSFSNYQCIKENRDIGYKVTLNKDLTTEQYLNSLSKNTRQQFRRSIKELESIGEIKFDVIQEKEQQLKVLEKTQFWHINKWKNTKTPSGFENHFFTTFHSLCIQEEHPNAKTYLTTLSLNKEIIGCLYLLQQQNCFYFYLSNLKPIIDNKIKLGITLHILMINWIIEKSSETAYYDFLAGDSRYKKSLSTSKDEYFKLTLQRSAIKFKIEKIINRIYKLFFK